MRELKFRAWDTVGRIMIYPSPHMNPLYLTLKGQLLEIDRDGEEYPAGNYQVTQFTGLQDKNGIDIYEGDILRHYKYGGDHAVEWHDDSTGFFLGEHSWPLTKLCCPNIEVVGNIFGSAITQP